MKNTLLAFLLFCSCALLAQNVQTTPGAAGGGGSGTINAGATNIIPKYTASTTLDDSLLSDDGTSLTYNATGGGKWCPSGATSGIFCWQVPATITSYNWTVPAADGVGRIKSDGAGILSIDDGNDATEAWMQDEFTGGLLTTGQIGALGWAMAGSAACGSATQPASVWPNLGQFQTTTGATSGNTCGITFATASALGALGSNAGWTMTWVFKIPTTTTMGAYVGASDSLTAVPSNWFGMRYDTASSDTVFKLCVSATCDATTYTLDTNFHKVRIRSTTAATILMKFDNNAERSFCAASCNTTVTPSTAVMTAIAQAVTRTTAARNVDVDYFAFRATGLSR
jgi:hypothetical protein